MSIRSTSAFWIALLAVLANRGIAEVPDAKTLQAAIEKSAERYEKAFAARSAKDIAALFTPEAEYVDASGTIFHGRDAIHAEYAASFETEPPGSVAIELISIRPIADGVVVEEGVSTFTPKNAGQASQTRYTATHVKQADGQWLIASVRELEAGRVTPRDRLQALAWLIGKWHEDVGGSHIATEWKRTDDGNFLMSEFTFRQSRDFAKTGTHRLGWDAERRQFRSWIFDSEGGAAEGWWCLDENGGWLVNLSGVDAEGVRSSSTLTYQRDGEDAIVISQSQRVRGGENLPNAVHRVVRQPPAPETVAKPAGKKKS